MRRTSLIMYISPALLVILYVYSGFSEAAPPRINQYDASSATISAPPRTGIISGTVGQISSRQIRSTDAQTTLFAPKKTLQTMVSMVSQRSANDAWSADSTGSVASIETSQEVVCNCSSGAEGILDPDDCDPNTGQCSCESGYTGLQCEDCEEGYFTNGTSGCLPCACDSYGAVNHLCDSSGTCVCKTGVYGPKCDDCHPGFFHFSSTGCRPCQCNNHTSNCHPQSGVCLNCEGNTMGSNCEECKPSFYRSPSSGSSVDCAPCPCSNATSNGTCHTVLQTVLAYQLIISRGKSTALELPSLQSRREQAAKRLVTQMCHWDHPLHELLPKTRAESSQRQLRNKDNFSDFNCRTNRLK